jgi:hypothetical protein
LLFQYDFNFKQGMKMARASRGIQKDGSCQNWKEEMARAKQLLTTIESYVPSLPLDRWLVPEHEKKRWLAPTNF